MRIRRLLAVSAVLVAVAPVAACSAAGDGATVACDDALGQASYEAMRQLAGAGLVADPDALAGAIAGGAGTDGASVRLPDYETLQSRYDDAQRAELLSALSSSMVGVGEYFDEQAFLDDLNSTGVCAGWLDAD